MSFAQHDELRERLLCGMRAYVDLCVEHPAAKHRNGPNDDQSAAAMLEHGVQLFDRLFQPKVVVAETAALVWLWTVVCVVVLEMKSPARQSSCGHQLPERLLSL